MTSWILQGFEVIFHILIRLQCSLIVTTHIDRFVFSKKQKTKRSTVDWTSSVSSCQATIISSSSTSLWQLRQKCRCVVTRYGLPMAGLADAHRLSGTNVYFLAASPWDFPSSKNHLGIYIHNYYITTTAHICILPACWAADDPRAKYWCNRRFDSRLICGLSNWNESLKEDPTIICISFPIRIGCQIDVCLSLFNKMVARYTSGLGSNMKILCLQFWWWEQVWRYKTVPKLDLDF